MQAFTYTALPARVVFGRGTRSRIGEEIRRLGCKRAMVLSTPEQEQAARELAAELKELAAGVLPAAVMHTPVEVTERALEQVRAIEADCTVALGGGSTIGLGKAIALRTGLPQVAVPTTYAGSEMTPILGQTEDGAKTTLRDPRVLPRAVVYDVDYTFTLPPGITATSGMNAIAHAVEALYAQDRNPITTLQCREAVRVLAGALPVLVENPGDPEARSDALFGAFLCGAALGSVGMALHHKLCHTLGGSFNLPHAETHTVVLPHAAAFNAPAADGALDPVADLLKAAGPGEGLFDLARKIGAPTSLAEIGMPADGLETAAELASVNPYWNPRPFGRDDILELLRAAHEGRRPVG